MFRNMLRLRARAVPTITSTPKPFSSSATTSLLHLQRSRTFATQALWSTAWQSYCTQSYDGRFFTNINCRRQQQQQQRRCYSPMTREEEAEEKLRVSKLSPIQKDQEMRALNRQVLKLNMLKGINSGELYTIRGQYKMLMSEYGFPMMMYWGGLWAATGVAVYALAEVGGMDAMAVLATMDSYTGLNMVRHVDPEMGKLGVVLILNECLEPVRLPFVVMTAKPVIDWLFPPKV